MHHYCTCLEANCFRAIEQTKPCLREVWTSKKKAQGKLVPCILPFKALDSEFTSESSALRRGLLARASPHKPPAWHSPEAVPPLKGERSFRLRI